MLLRRSPNKLEMPRAITDRMYYKAIEHDYVWIDKKASIKYYYVVKYLFTIGV